MTRILIALFACAVMTAGCSGPKRSAGGGYYKDDGPGTRHVNIHAVPDAVPRIEPHKPANMRPYKVFGRQYVPITSERPFRQKGIASWYGRKFHGKKTANGETYDMYAMTAAHPTLPLPSYARVTHARTGKSVIVRINDRGPFHPNRIIDLSYVAAAKLDLIKPGSGPVIVETITHEDIRQNAWQRGTEPAAKPMPIPAAPAPASPPTLTASADTGALNFGGGALSTAHVDVRRDETRNAVTTPGTSATQVQNADVDALSVLDAQTLSMLTTEASYEANNTEQADAVDTAHPPAAAAVFLQYGAFSARENAHRLASSLNAEIGHIEPRRAQVSNTDNLYRVRIGPYTSRTQAVNAALRIEAATGRQASYTVHDATDNDGATRTAVSL